MFSLHMDYSTEVEIPLNKNIHIFFSISHLYWTVTDGTVLNRLGMIIGTLLNVLLIDYLG